MIGTRTYRDNYRGEETMATGEQLMRVLAQEVVAEAGFDLEDLSVANAGRRRLVQVIIDGDDGVPLDAAAAVSRALSAALDAAEERDAAAFGGSPYTLEVTSPGIGRPLTEPRHFHRARGRLVSLMTADGRSMDGRLLGVTDTGVDLLTGKSGTEHRHLAFGEISRAKVEVDFSGPSQSVAALLAADPRTAHLQREEVEIDLDDADADSDSATATDPDTDSATATATDPDTDADTDTDSDTTTTAEEDR